MLHPTDADPYVTRDFSVQYLYFIVINILTHKAPPIICSRRQFEILLLFFKNNKSGMIFHENRLLADDSHEIPYHIFLIK